MPRLTNKDYLKQRSFLTRVWEKYPNLFADLTPSDQLALHAYYHPTKNLTNDEAIALRHEIPSSDSLAQRAGKLYQQLYRRAQQGSPAPVTTRPKAKAMVPAGRNRKVYIKTLVRPEPDVKLLAEALLGYARDLQERKRGETE